MFFLGQEGTSTVEKMVSKQLSLERAMEDPWAQGDQEFVQMEVSENLGILPQIWMVYNDL